MSINNKRDGFERGDFVALANSAGIKKTRANQMLDRVVEAAGRWPDFAERAEVSDVRRMEIQANLRQAI